MDHTDEKIIYIKEYSRERKKSIKGLPDLSDPDIANSFINKLQKYMKIYQSGIYVPRLKAVLFKKLWIRKAIRIAKEQFADIKITEMQRSIHIWLYYKAEVLWTESTSILRAADIIEIYPDEGGEGIRMLLIYFTASCTKKK